MLHVPFDVARHTIEHRNHPFQPQLSPAMIRDVLRWRRSIIIACVLGAVGLAVLYLLVAPQKFTATAVLMLDTKRAPSEEASNDSVDAIVVDSQVEVLRSDKIALAVVDKLGLWNDPEFVGPDLVGRIFAALSPSGPQPQPKSTDVLRQIASGRLERGLDVERAGRSYVADVSFTSHDRETSALIANAAAQAYIDDQLTARLQIAQRSTDWLQNRLKELREQALAAANAVKAFGSKVDTGGNDAQTRQPPLPGSDTADGQALRELEAKARSAAAIHQSFLEQYTQRMQIREQSLPVTNARVIAEAVPPLAKSAPKDGLVVLLALFAGGTLGLIGAFWCEFVERLVRTPRQLERELGVRSLGLLPRVKQRRLMRMGGRPLDLLESSKGSSIIPDYRPLSLAGETVRGMKVALDRSRSTGGNSGQLLGILSPRRGAGRTTLAYNLALLTARCGGRTLLIDGDLRKPTLTRTLAHSRHNGLPSLLTGDAEANDCVTEHRPRLDFLGGFSRTPVSHPSEILGSAAMTTLLGAARQSYDYIVVDLPSLLDCVDVQAVAPLIQSYILVAEWGQTTVNDLDRALASCDIVVERLVGVVINRISVSEMQRQQ
jgi:polysaccharide biosynthesis transport protein